MSHDGNADLALQQQLLAWFKECLPAGAPATIIADREFHSIWLATWIEQALGLNFLLRPKAGTYLKYRSQWFQADALSPRGRVRCWHSVKVTLAQQGSTAGQPGHDLGS